MTCVLLPCSKDIKDEKPHITMQESLSKVLGKAEDYLFRIKNSQYTFLLPPKVFEAFNNNTKVFASYLLKLLKEEGVECSLLFDSYIFKQEENAFKEDYYDHINRMLTEIFFSPAEIMYFNPDLFKIGKKKCFECKYLEAIKQHLLSRNREGLFKTVEELTLEVQKLHLGIQFIQDIDQRIYYVILDEIAMSNSENGGEPVLDHPRWLDYSYFISFDMWKEMLFSLISEGLAFIERRCKMVNLGISREVIEYVHQHYKEQINVKEIADKFFVNATYLGRVFQKATGFSFKHYVNNLRISEAKKLLLYTNKLIYEIAEEVGYTESKYFIVKFAQEVGKSPTEYRNQM
jgi:two-component system response regulator YesN